MVARKANILHQIYMIYLHRDRFFAHTCKRRPVEPKRFSAGVKPQSTRVQRPTLNQNRDARESREEKGAQFFFFFQFPIQLKFLHFCLSSDSLVFPSHHLSPVSQCSFFLGRREAASVSEQQHVTHSG